VHKPYTPILLLFSHNAAIVDKSFSAHPLNKVQRWRQQISKEAAYEWNPGELKPGDWAGIRLLLAPSAEVDWTWRGDDDVEIASSGREGVRTLEIELRDMIAWIALFIFVGGVPFFSGAAQGALLFVSIPYLVPRFTRWLGMLNVGRGFSSIFDTSYAVEWTAVRGSRGLSAHVLTGDAETVEPSVKIDRRVSASALGSEQASDPAPGNERALDPAPGNERASAATSGNEGASDPASGNS
jgi:hypothetical protein